MVPGRGECIPGSSCSAPFILLMRKLWDNWGKTCEGQRGGVERTVDLVSCGLRS